MVGDMPKLGNSGRVGWFGTTSMHYQPDETIMVGDMAKRGKYVRVGVEQPRCIFINLVR